MHGTHRLVIGWLSFMGIGCFKPTERVLETTGDAGAVSDGAISSVSTGPSAPHEGSSGEGSTTAPLGERTTGLESTDGNERDGRELDRCRRIFIVG